jgi:hypothetical protein
MATINYFEISSPSLCLRFPLEIHRSLYIQPSMYENKSVHQLHQKMLIGKLIFRTFLIVISP